MIEVRHLTKRYRDLVAVDDLSFTVGKGEVVGFLGPNGAGKSTTMRILAGFLPASSGSVQVAGFDVFENPREVKRRVGYLPEHPPVYDALTVRACLRFCADLKGLPRQTIGSEIDRVAALAGVAGVMGRVAGNLSKGFKQRLGLAQALLGDPEVLVLYEPTVGLDPLQIREVRDLVRSLAGRHTVTGYVHPFDTRPDPFNRTEPIRYEMPINVALGTLDYFEVMGFSDHLITSEFWYRLLNTGFRLPAAAGTDAFPNYASLRGPPGLVRVYARSGPALEHRSWLEAIRLGRTFVTNGPLLGLGVRVDGQADGGATGRWYGIGDDISLPAGAHRLRFQLTLRSNLPVDHLELVRNGKVVGNLPVHGERTRADTAITVPVTESGWYVLRAYADPPATPILDLYPFASTSPVYVTVGGQRKRSGSGRFLGTSWPVL